MTRRRIGFLGFDDVQALDLFGPADAFASDALRGDPHNLPYEVLIFGLGSRHFRTSAGTRVAADAATPETLALDTLVIPGGAGLRAPGVAERAAEWIRGCT